MRLPELRNKYQAAKKTARHYRLWADGKERHVQQEWQCIGSGLQNILQVVNDRQLLLTVQLLTMLLMTVHLLTVQLDEQIQSLQDTLYSTHPPESCDAWWLLNGIWKYCCF